MRIECCSGTTEYFKRRSDLMRVRLLLHYFDTLYPEACGTLFATAQRNVFSSHSLADLTYLLRHK